MKKEGLFIIVFLLILIPVISAVPPFQTSDGTVGLDIRYPQTDVIKQGRSITYHTHVYNLSNGLLVTNATTNCHVHLFNSTGDHILERDMSFSNNNKDFQLFIDGGNFSTVQRMSAIVQCNSSSEGGFVSFGFEVNPTGFTLETSESNLYIIILIATFILFLAFLYPAIKLPYANIPQADGSITKINKTKYFKLLSIWFAYGFLMWFLQTLNAISSSFIQLTYLSNFITNIFTYSQGVSVGVTFLILIILFIEVWKDIILSKTIKRYGKAFIDGRLQ